MKKAKKFLLMFLILFLNISLVSAGDNLKFETAQKMIKEVMDAYYNRRTAIQYNFSKATYGEQSPEEATSQDTKYDVCGAFVSDVYSETFGIKHNSTAYNKKYSYNIEEKTTNLFEAFPKLNEHSIEAARVYLDASGKDSSNYPLDGNFLIYYEKPSKSTKYLYNQTGNVTYSTVAKKLQPGDIVVYTGHVMMVYDVITNEENQIDALLINATSGPFNHNVNGDSSMNALIPSRLSGTDKLIYNIFGNDNGKPIWLKDNTPIWGSDGTIFFTPTLGNNYKIVDDTTSEGAVQKIKLSKVDELVDQSNNYFRCVSDSAKVDECAIIRPFYKTTTETGEIIAQFNYPSNAEKIKKSGLRLKYPGLIIEKTVDKGDNNSVYVGDNLTYTIKIKNTSSQAYGNFRVEEILDNQLSYNGENIEGNKIYWDVNSSLGVNETLTLTFTVTVKDVINESSEGLISIESKGNFFGYYENGTIDTSTSISTGTIKNNVLRRTSVTLSENYDNCKNVGDNVTGLAYIDAVYNCVYKTNYDFSSLNSKFINMFVKREDFEKDNKLPGKTAARAIDLRKSDDTSIQKYQKMILNNYWSGLATHDSNLILPAWVDGSLSSSDYNDLNAVASRKTHLRARTIRPQDFQNGDVLIYYVDSNNLDSNTNESGLYSYIYIDGQFVGNNARTIFDYNYYKTVVTVSKNLYYGNNTIHSSENGYTDTYRSMLQEILNFANYQTLYGKDYYVILRPEKVMKAGIKVKNVTQKSAFLHGKEYTVDNIKDMLEGTTFVQFYGDNSYDTLTLENQIKDKVAVTLDTSEKGKKNLKLTYDNQTTTLSIEVIENKYTVTFDSNGKIIGTKEVTYDETYGNLTNPEARAGYTFEGWYLDSQYQTKVTKDTKVTNPEAHTLYAKWIKDGYTLTINPEGGIYNGDLEVFLRNNETKQIEDPIKEGYTFKGWEISGTNSSIKNKIFTMGISNTILRSKWELFIPNIEETSNYKLKDTLIKNITLGTNLNNLKLGLSNIYNIKLYNKSLDEKTSEKLATGDIIKIYLEGLLVSEYTAVVKGDVIGNGTSNVSDVAKLYQALKGKIDIEDCYKEAGNVVDTDNEIK